MTKKAEQPADLDGLSGEANTPGITTMPTPAEKEELLKKWVESVDARFAAYHELLAELATLPQRVADAQRTIELSIAARVAKEQLTILIDTATAGIMAGMGEEVDRWRRELADRFKVQDARIASCNKKQNLINRILAITAVAISIGAVIISMV